MNRIIAFVIVASLTLIGSNVFAQRPAQMPRPVQQTEDILYANERTSVVPGYRGYRRAVDAKTSQAASTFRRSTRKQVAPKSNSLIAQSSPVQVTKAAPVIESHSQRMLRGKVQSSTPESPSSLLSAIERTESQTEVVESRAPVNASPDFIIQSLSSNGQKDPQLSQWQPLTEQVHGAQKTTQALPAEQSETTEAAPVIARSSRRVTTEIVEAAPVIARSSRRITTEVAEAAPVIDGSARRVRRVEAPASEDQASVLYAIDSPQTQTNVVKTTTPADISPIEQPEITEGAPLIDPFARRITKIKVPVPTSEAQVSSSDSIEASPVQVDIVKTETPVIVSPNFKYRSTFDFDRKDLQQSQWKPRAKQGQDTEQQVTISSPDDGRSLEPLTAIDDSNLFEVVESAFSKDSVAVAVPSEAALLDSEEASPFTSLSPETAALPTVETESTVIGSQSVAEVEASVTSTEVATTAKRSAAQKVRTSFVKENSQQKTAIEAWWFMLPLLVVPVLVLLGWALLGRDRQKQYAEVPSIDIPRQTNTPWQKAETDGTELSGDVLGETHSAGFRSIHVIHDELDSETELLDEIKSISSIASSSNSTPTSTPNARVKADKTEK